jgi:hypothetical protein
MKKRLIAGLVLAGGCLFAGPRIGVGVGFGAPAVRYAAPAYVAPGYVEPAYVPPCPGPDYVFVGGRWEHRAPVIVHRDRDREVRHDRDRR